MKKTIKTFFDKHPHWRSFVIANIVLIVASVLASLITQDIWEAVKTIYLAFGIPVFMSIIASKEYPEVGDSARFVSWAAYYIPIFVSRYVLGYINWDLVVVLALLIINIALGSHYKSMYVQALRDSKLLANRYRRALLNYISEEELSSLDDAFDYNEVKK